MHGDQEQLRRFLESGDVLAFEELVAKYLPVVLSTAERRCGDHWLAEEAAQNAFAILARKASSLVTHPTIGGWLHRTAMFEASHLERSERIRRRTMKKLADEEIDTTGDLENAPSRAHREEIDQALSKLRPTDRDILLLRFFDELSFSEIGERLGKSDRAARKQSERALSKMRGVLNRSRTVLPCSVAAALVGQFTKSNASTASISTGALSASRNLPLTTITIHTILTMSYLKPTIVVALLLLILWPISHALRNKANGDPKFAPDTPVEQVQREAAPNRDPSELRDVASAIKSAPPESDSDAAKLRAMGRVMAGIKLNERVLALRYADGPPDPKSERYPEYVADMNAFLKMASSTMTKPPMSGSTLKNRLRGPESMSQVLASMVTAVLDLDPEEKTKQPRLEAVFKAAVERRERDGLRRSDRDSANLESWEEGVVAWRRELYAELGRLLSADEVARVKSRLGFDFVEDPFEFPDSASMGPSQINSDPAEVATELETIEALLADESGDDTKPGLKDEEQGPIVVPDIDQLGAEIAELFRVSRTINTSDSEAVEIAVDQWSGILAGAQVHRETLENTLAAASLVGDVIANFIDATPEEAESIGEIVLTIREDAEVAGMFEVHPEDPSERERWELKRREFIEESEAQLHESVSPERATKLEELLNHWNPLVDVANLQGLLGF